MTGTSINSLLLLGELIQCGMVCGKQFCCNTSLFFLEFSFWRLKQYAFAFLCLQSTTSNLLF